MLAPGETIDRYVIESLLGRGGMGAVYRAHDPRIDRAVAVKIVHVTAESTDASRAEATARLLREARAAAKLEHANAINIYDVGVAGDSAFIVMELVDGRTLRDHITDGSLSYAEKVRVLTDMARALAAAHRADIVHRDVKPDNIMIRRDGAVKVLDFGIARRVARAVDPTAPTESGAILTLTAAGVPIGTPLYMTPEQIRGEPLDGRSDQFAWGVVAWEVLSGELPWAERGDAMALAGAILQQPVGSLAAVAPDVDPAVSAVVTRALAKSPGDRHPSMQDVIVALERCAAGASVPPAAASEQAKPPSFGRYSTVMTRAILERALDLQAQTPANGYEREDVLAAAREVGVDEETLRAAEREVLDRRAGDAATPSPRGREWRKLIRHLVAYAAVVTFSLVTMGWWFGKWVLFGWGIGVAMHAMSVILPDTSGVPSKKKRDRKRGRVDRDQAAEIERGAGELLTTAAARRVRVQATAPVRVAVGNSEPRAEVDAESERADGEERADRARRVGR